MDGGSFLRGTSDRPVCAFAERLPQSGSLFVEYHPRGRAFAVDRMPGAVALALPDSSVRHLELGSSTDVGRGDLSTRSGELLAASGSSNN